MRIDVHTHLMSVAFVEHLQGRDALPVSVREGAGFVAHCGPSFSLHLQAPILDVKAKLRDMDAAGIDLAVLSHGLPSPAMLGGTEADGWAARINDELAAISACRPDRFGGWANLGFGDPGRTIAEVDRCLDELNLAGFQVWSNVGGRPLDAPDVLPVLEHIADRGAAVHLHPTLPADTEAGDAATMLGFAFPVDTSLGVLRLIGAGLFDRDLTVVVAHLGGVLPWLQERLTAHGQDSAPFADKRRLARPPGEYLGQLNVDTVGYGAAPLKYCYAQLGADRLLFGTDHPFGAPHLPNELVDSVTCTQTERERILAGNAQRLLRLDPVVFAAGDGEPRSEVRAEPITEEMK
jgi:aminocarboxymuconate-semialdehyde decarboxylase